jgi:glucokinase
MLAVVFDIGGTYLRAAVAYPDGTLTRIHKERIKSHAAEHAKVVIWESVLVAMERFVDSVKVEAPSAPLVVAFPGPIGNGMRVLSAPTLHGSGFRRDVAEELRARTGRPVHLLNDVAAAAWYLSAHIDAGRFMVVTVSSGIGSKVFDRRHPAGVLDDLPHGGEIGHCGVDFSEDALLCDCGRRGHLGAIASGRGVERTARALAQRDVTAFNRSICVGQFGATPVTLSNEHHLVPAARLGDRWALSVLRECTVPLARMLAAIFLGVGLERIVVIGGFASALGSQYLRILQEEFRRASDYELLDDCHSVIIELRDTDEETCLLGAAAYVRTHGGGSL